MAELPFDPGFMVELAAIEVSNIQIDSPEYKKARYEMSMNRPGSADLKWIVKIHDYIRLHDGEPMTQGAIGEAVGCSQSNVHAIMDKYASFFRKNNGSYEVLQDISTEWRQAFDDLMKGKPQNDEPYNSGIRNIDRDISKKLDKVLAEIREVRALADAPARLDEKAIPAVVEDTVGERAYLDKTIVKKIQDRIGDMEQYLDDWDTEERVALLYWLIGYFDARPEAIMEIVSRNIK